MSDKGIVLSADRPLHERPGVIGILHRAIGFRGFDTSLIVLEKPANTGTSMVGGTAIAQQRNIVVRQFLARPGYSWLLFIDDDQIFPADSLMRLLRHDKPVISAVISTKNSPFIPQVFVHAEPETGKTLRRATHQEIAGDRTIEVAAVGMGFTLIRRDVLEGMQEPWFAADSNGIGEDVYFSLQARRAGFTLWADTSLKIGHLTVVSVAFSNDGEAVFTQDRYMPRETITAK